MNYAIALLTGYILGSIPCGLVFVKMICGIDIRHYGSHNIGTTNVFRTAGARMASLVLLGDMLKGVAAVLLIKSVLGPNLALELVAAVGAMLGHNYSVFLHFKGGRGVATGLGLILLFMPEVSIFAFTVWLAIVFVTRYVSLGSIIAAILTPLGAWYMNYPMPLILFAAAACLFIVVRHYENILRLLNGSESKIKQGHLNDDTKNKG